MMPPELFARLCDTCQERVSRRAGVALCALCTGRLAASKVAPAAIPPGTSPAGGAGEWCYQVRAETEWARINLMVSTSARFDPTDPAEQARLTGYIAAQTGMAGLVLKRVRLVTATIAGAETGP